MIELPEVVNLEQQLRKTVGGKTITRVFNATHPHRFTFYNGDPKAYGKLLEGRTVKDVRGAGIFVDILLDEATTLSVHDGVNMRYGDASAKIPEKYQLLITFDDESFLVFTVAMYGGIYAYKGVFDNKYHRKSREKVSPLSNRFDEAYFNTLFLNEKPTLTAKALLASKQRIPGVGNGVLQDILFNAKINPKRKISTLSDEDKSRLFVALKTTLAAMAKAGGRDTETDIFGKKGKYKTLLSKNTYQDPCPICGAAIKKESYMGGSVYYCPICQKTGMKAN